MQNSFRVSVIKQMPAFDHQGFSTEKSLAVFARLASTSYNLLVNVYSYHDCRRLMTFTDDGVGPGVDGLGGIIIDGLDRLKFKERIGAYETEIEPLASAEIMFGDTDMKDKNPKLYVGFDMRSSARVSCCCTTISYSVSDSFATSKFTREWCRKKGVPSFNAQWLLLDVVSSKIKGCGAICILYAWLQVLRSKKQGLVAVAVSERGRVMFQKLGFTVVDFSDGGRRSLCYAKAGELDIGNMVNRIQIGGGKDTLQSLCFRMGLTGKSRNSLIARCPR